MNCKCCKLEVEVRDEAQLCHYCYLRDCGSNPGNCANSLPFCGDHIQPIKECGCLL